MRPETAYRLAGRHHDHPPVAGANAGIHKCREIRFKKLPPGQVEQARRALAAVAGVEVESLPPRPALRVRYSVLEHSLEMLETALANAGFVLDGSLYSRLTRALVYFCEETQRHNLLSPERLLKQSNAVYVQAWSHHPHGDHDDAPPELREYR